MEQYTRRRTIVAGDSASAMPIMKNKDLTAPKKRELGPNPRGPGICPKCGREFKRISMHMRSCSGTGL